MVAGIPFRRVAVVGLGLMGGSLARALRRLDAPPVVSATSLDPGDLAQALADGSIQRAVDDPAAAVADADLVVYATPVGVTLELLEAHRAHWPAHAVVTDLGSVKQPVMERVRTLGLEDRFVGGHPMAGHHGRGYGAATGELYAGARVWLTAAAPGEGAGRDAGRGVAALWRAVGARPEWIAAEAHDEMVGWASHLPQVVSSALGAALAGAGTPPEALGPGGRDMTRLAASPGALWRDILLHNADVVTQGIEEMERIIGTFRRALADGDGEALEALLSRGRRWREGR